MVQRRTIDALPQSVASATVAPAIKPAAGKNAGDPRP